MTDTARAPRNPFAPVRTRTTPETQSELEHAVLRLEQLGARQDEIDSFVEQWDAFEDGVWTPEIRDAWLRSRDSELISELRAIRAEYKLGTTTEEDAEAEEAARAARTLNDEAAGIIGSNVPRVLEWVGNDLDKARVVFELETMDQVGAGRKGVLDALAAQFGDDLIDDDEDGVEVE